MYRKNWWTLALGIVGMLVGLTAIFDYAALNALPFNPLFLVGGLMILVVCSSFAHQVLWSDDTSRVGYAMAMTCFIIEVGVGVLTTPSDSGWPLADLAGPLHHGISGMVLILLSTSLCRSSLLYKPAKSST